MPKIFFTSDTHFGHTNIIKYCNRPFKDVKEMDKTLIENWNAKVSPDDIVYHLGDFALYSVDNIFDVIKQLNGYIFFVPGNHDKNLLKAIEQYKFELGIKIQILPKLYQDTILIGNEKIPFVMCHYAMRVWDKSHYGAIHLYGHSHGTMPDDPSARSMDVGVDTNNMQLYSIEDVLVHMYRKVDHHE